MKKSRQPGGVLPLHAAPGGLAPDRSRSTRGRLARLLLLAVMVLILWANLPAISLPPMNLRSRCECHVCPAPSSARSLNYPSPWLRVPDACWADSVGKSPAHNLVALTVAPTI